MRSRSKRRYQLKKRVRKGLKKELNDLVRGLCGGFLFGIPMLYTIEVWWIGSSVPPLRILAILTVTMLSTYLLSSTAGFRKSQATTQREAFADAVEAIALGLLCATVMLIILQQITPDTRFSEALGKIILESVPFSIGVALANQFLQGSEDSPEDNKSNNASSKQLSKLEKLTSKTNLNETISDIGATLLGSIIIAFSIAPTEEVTILVAAVKGPWLMLTVLISLVLSYCIVFQANFTRQARRQKQQGLFQDPISETIFAYLLSLVSAALMLSFFGKLDPTGPLDLAFRQILILGLPAAIGGAAGRLTV